MSRTDTASRHVRAAPGAIYRAFTSAEALMAWLPPAGMTGRATTFEPWPGGRYRIELVYAEQPPGGSGKSGEGVDVSAGTFVELEPNCRVVMAGGFESDDPAFAGQMTLTWSFEPVPAGTRVVVTAEGVPEGISAEDHAAGLASSLANLAAHLERPFYHGTRADLAPGDLIAAGYVSNYYEGKAASWVYFACTLEASIWGAELAQGGGRERIYVVEPTGPFYDDPNLTDKRFPGNPTESYRSREPLRVVAEVTSWQGHSPEQVQAMKDAVQRLKEQGIEAID